MNLTVWDILILGFLITTCSRPGPSDQDLEDVKDAIVSEIREGCPTP